MRILIADDDEICCELLKETLAESGLEPVVVHDGKQALRAFNGSNPPQLAILDWIIPGMNGIEVCRKLRKSYETSLTYLILLTSQESESHILEGFEAGADDYVTKPFEPRQLLARIKAGERIIRLQNALNYEREELKRLANELSEMNLQLRYMAETDQLTGLNNRSSLMKRLSQEWTLSARLGLPLTCLMLDIDHFKHLNDTYGHIAGDEVLSLLGRALKNSVREYDFACRYGGEEFVILCPNINHEEALQFAETLCISIESASAGIIPQHPDSITVSIGVATKSDAISSAEELLKTADDALYAAKQSGRNCVRSARDLIPSLTEPEGF